MCIYDKGLVIRKYKELNNKKTNKSCDPDILLLDTYSGEMNTHAYTKTYTLMYVTALFVIAENFF